MLIAWEEYWWNNITGPHQIVTSVAGGLLDKKTVVLQVPSDLPWRHEMRRTVQALVKQNNGFSDTNIEVVDAVDENLADNDPGKYLLNRFGMYEIQNGYRAKSGLSLQDYIIRHKVLKNTIVWVKGLTEAQTEKWVRFCKGYNSDELSNGLFVLECVHKSEPSDSRNLTYVSFDRHVRRYDLQLFNSILLDNQGFYPDLWKQYISTLAAYLCVNDGEVAEQYIRLCDFLRDEPIAGLGKIIDSGGFERRGTDPASTHVLALYRTGKIEDLTKRIWAAQLHILFPLIEMRRTEVIRVLEPELKNCLSNHRVEQFDQVISNPMEIEFGTLIYLMARYDDAGYRWIHVPDEQLRSDIHFLRDCRNTLAHGNVCSVDAVRRLFECSIPPIVISGYSASRVS